MNISGFTNYNINQPDKRCYPRAILKKENNTDSFELHSNPVFTGNRHNIVRKTVEEIYTNIDGLHDPYSDVIMISKKKFKEFTKKTEKQHNSDSMIRLLGNYTQHLFKPEKQMLEIFALRTKQAKISDPKKAKDLTLHSILQELLPGAKLCIKPEQRTTIQNMENISQLMSKESRAKLEPLFKQTKEEIENDTFRIQPTIKAFESMRKQIPETKLFNNLIEEAAQFPSSATSVNAFIVKNANKTDQEIAIAMVKPAHITIEHIQPKSQRGESSANNYIAASARMNNLRKSLSLPKLIRRYPKIPQYTQRYFDDLIQKVNRGGLKQIGITIPNVKQQLYDVSKHFIDINIDKLSPHIIRQNVESKTQFEKLMAFFSDKGYS